MMLVLSKPPSVNHLYGHNKWGGLYLKPQAIVWIKESLYKIKFLSKVNTTYDTPVKVDIEFYTTMSSDLDNILKLTLDLLAKHAQIIKNDNLVMEMHLRKIKTKKVDQKLVINIEPL